MLTKNTCPLVSIVIATYDGEKFLEKQLESIFLQTYPNLEIVIIDDGSTDGTLSIVNKYTALYKNVKFFLNGERLGYIKNFEKGCSLSKGDFIAFCDQDDYWHKDKIKRLVEEIDIYPMIYSDSVLCGEKLQPIGANISDRVSTQSFHSCIQQAVFCRVYGNTILIKRSLYQQAAPFLSIIPHDWWLCYVATLHGGIKYLNEPLVYYRQHSFNVFGAVGSKRRRRKKNNKKVSKQKALAEIRMRMRIFYKTCPGRLIKEKKILYNLMKSYQNFSFINNIYRVCIFFKYHKLLLAVKKHSVLHRYLFCLKMFIKIK